MSEENGVCGLVLAFSSVTHSGFFPFFFFFI